MALRSGVISWGAPDFGVALARPRLTRQLLDAGDRLRLIAAPSGWGKSVLASQYSFASDRETLWIDVHSPDVDLAALVSDAVNFLSPGSVAEDNPFNDAVEAFKHRVIARSTKQAGLLIVVDNLSLSSGTRLGQLEYLASSVRCADAIMLVTTRDRHEQTSSVLALGAQQLRLTADEAVAIASDGFGTDGQEASRLAQLSNGHPALFEVLLAVNPSDVLVSHRESRIGSLIRGLIHETRARLNVSALIAASLLGHGDDADLRRLGVCDSASDLLQIAESLPLFAVHYPGAGSRISFRMHDLLQQELVHGGLSDCAEREVVARVCCLLVERGDFDRAVEVLLQHGDEGMRLDFLDTHIQSLGDAAEVSVFAPLAASVPMHEWVASPRRLLSLAYILRDDDCCAAASRARAAYALAKNEGEAVVADEAMSLWLTCLGRGERYEEAARVVSEEVCAKSASIGTRIQAAASLACVGQFVDARSLLDSCVQAGSLENEDASTRAYFYLTFGTVIGMGFGDFLQMGATLSPFMALADEQLVNRTLFRGNMAFAMCETGRLDRAIALASSACASEIPRLVANFLPLIGAARVGAGESAAGLIEMREGIQIGIDCGMDIDTASNRTIESCILRALGMTDEALTSAERAYERLLGERYMRVDRLAALEVAASLLALGDVAAGRRWAEKVASDGFDGNAYHALRGAMILAECDRRDGEMSSGIARLAEHRVHIISESSNWQMAMYVRAFPELLGMLASAVGVETLPVHMLKMVLPEYAERSLRASREWMDRGEWENLGRRVLGESDFTRLQRRDGEPICRVRLFGGLDVVLGDRVIGERDWKKRKARLMFAMLVAQRGRELPRDQILEHLWGDMSDENARNNFYVAWSAMKSALVGKATSCPYLENAGGRCRIVPDALRSDIDEFEEALAEARIAEANSDARSALEGYGRLLTVYRGDLLPADVYDDWFLPLRDRYRLEFVDAMLRATQILLDQDDPCEALVYARRALGVDPLREDLYQMALKCHIVAGQRSNAIDTFIQCKTKLVDDLGLDPSAETMALYQEILVMEDRPRQDHYGLS